MDNPERKARTESAFRDVNERIAENAQRFDSGSTEFICECNDSACSERIEVTLGEYERVRAARDFCGAKEHEQRRELDLDVEAECTHEPRAILAADGRARDAEALLARADLDA